MTERDDRQELQRSRKRHARRTVTTLGLLLLLAAILGSGAEIYRRAIETGPGELGLTYTSFRGTLPLTLRSFQGALPIVLVLVAVPLFVARFVRDLHGTTTLGEAHNRLNHLLFGGLGRSRRLLVKEGRVASGTDKVAKRVGGPASLTIYDDSAVVTEQCGRLHRVLLTGTHTLGHYERIWQTIDLRRQRWVRQVCALTKEGIPVRCDVDILYRIDTGLGSEEAVLRAATSAWICRDDDGTRTVDWAERVAALVETTLRDVVATYRLDWLIKAPQSEQPHPRDEIHAKLKDQLSDHLPDLGAELLDVDLGRIAVGFQADDGSEKEEVSETLSEMISDQWIDAWHAHWKARALTSQAEGEAELLRMDVARIEAQAEMLIGLAEALQPVANGEPASEPYVLALRLVEALHWMSYDPKTRDYMPPEAIRTLQRLQQLLASEAAIGEQRRPDRGESQP